MARFVEQAFAEKPVEWQEKGRLRIGANDTYYQFFSPDEDRTRCASFEWQWGRVYIDTRHRNSALAGGFYCRDGGLEEGHIERFLSSLTLR